MQSGVKKVHCIHKDTEFSAPLSAERPFPTGIDLVHYAKLPIFAATIQTCIMSASTIQSPHRIEYIDALRGFTMILVVFAHVEMTSFGFVTPTFINSLFMSFRMPLFFFISGFIGYKASTQWNWSTWWAMSKKKLLIQLIPTFIFGVLYAYAYFQSDFHTFITHNGKLGYWFTIALLEIFLIVYTASTCLYSSNPKTHRKRMLIALILLSGTLFLTKIILKLHPTLNEVGNVLSLHHSFNYFQYFPFFYSKCNVITN